MRKKTLEGSILGMYVGKITKTSLKFTHKMVRFRIQFFFFYEYNNWLLNYLFTNKIILAAAIIN
jgi:hypothetical protein